MKSSLDTTVMTAEKIHSFGNNFNNARKFAKANGITTITTNITSYLCSDYNNIRGKDRKAERKLGSKVTGNMVLTPYSFSYTV